MGVTSNGGRRCLFGARRPDLRRRAQAATEVAREPLPAKLPAPPLATNSPTAKERAAELLQAADVALANGEYVEALTLLQQARALDPQAAALRDLTDTAEQQRAVAETRAQRRRAFMDHLAAAADMLAKGDVSGASERVREALNLKPNDPDAVALQMQISQAQGKPKARKGPPRKHGSESDLIDS